MNKVLNIMINTFKPWFAVDTRAIGLFRIVFGILCLSDIIRRWDFIDIFYTQASIIQSTLTSSSNKNFTILIIFKSSWVVHFFYSLCLIFSQTLKSPKAY